MKKLLLILIIFLNNSCDNKECYVDDVYVNKIITLTDEEFEELQLNGSYKFIEGGNAGIIIYHMANNEFKAFDRICSYQSCSECSFIDSISSGIAYCKCCTSAFLLDQNGNAINKPAIAPLKQYYCLTNGQILRIYN
tara:strand:+ start:84 stop:494 length:411 start_codon:yes stop_codon:yes gene_type:complete